jgi:hypothetical protein
MNPLGKFLADSILEQEQTKTVALYGGGFKPPHKGHFEVVEQALKSYPQIDEFIVYVGSGVRDGIEQAESLLVWDIYRKYLPLKVKIEPVNSPITAIYDYIKNHPDEQVIWVIGAREGKDDDFVDIASRTKGLGKYSNVELAPIVTQLDTSGTDARKSLAKGQEAFNAFIPDKVKEKTEVYNILSNKLTENILPNNDLNKRILELTKYMVEQGMNIKPLPKVKFVHNDEENANNILGKTAYYNPSDKSITLFTLNRHPKDILRSFSHEMIHHEQNLDNRLTNIGTTNTNEDGDLPEIEKEAYQKGNMMLRNWEDKIKNPVNEIYIDISKFNSIPNTLNKLSSQLYELKIKEITLNPNNSVNIDGDLFDGEFKVGDIEYTYSIKSISNPYNDNKSFYNIQFDEKHNDALSNEPTGNAKENYIKILSTIYKIILNFIKTEKPDYIGISSLDKSGYNNIYNNLTKTNKIPGYSRKDSGLPFTTKSGDKGKFIVLKKTDV